jgi:hypothetical protein
MTDWIESNDNGDNVTKYLVIGWIALLYGIVQLVAGLLNTVTFGINSSGIFLCALGGVAGAIGLASVMIASIRSK